MTATRVEHPNDWIALAIKLEQDFAATEKAKPKPEPHPKKSSVLFNTIRPKQKQGQSSRLPPYPCRHCKTQQGIEAYHWHNECPINVNASPASTSADTPVNFVQGNDEQPDQPIVDTLTINTLDQSSQFIFANFRINNKLIRGFIDTGSAITIIGER